MKKNIFVFAGLLFLASCSKSSITENLEGQWESIPLIKARDLHTATALPDGRVLIVGGKDGLKYSEEVTKSSEIFEPILKRFTPGPQLEDSRIDHCAVRIGSDILVAGGRPSLKSAFLVDGTGAGLAPVSPMIVGREGFVMTALNDGSVLVIGGGGKGEHDTAEIYDAKIRHFTLAGKMNVNRFSCPATLLRDGRVLLTGGTSSDPSTYNMRIDDAEIYDPTTCTFSKTGFMKRKRAVHASTLLEDGRVLITGGIGESGITASAELYDPETGVFRETSPLKIARSSHTAVLLHDGRVLITGGTGDVDSKPKIFNEVELFDPSSESFFMATSMNIPRQDHTATVMENGDVLVVGGWTGMWNGIGSANTAEIFHIRPQSR